MKVLTIRYAAVALVMVSLLLAFADVKAEIDFLVLKRIIYINQAELVLTSESGLNPEIDPEIINIPGVGHDSMVEAPRAQGTLHVEYDAGRIIRGMRFEAWNRGKNQPIVDDWLITLDYVNGRYEMMSLWDNEQFFITFIRREDNHGEVTASIIFMVDLPDDSTVLLDYQYPDGE